MDFILKRKVLISMLFLGLTLLGYVSYKRLQIELLPNSQLPTLLVQVSATQEMDPSYIETQAIVPLEGAIGTLEGIDKIESTITSRSGTITVYYDQNADMKYTNLKLQEKINLVKASLPSEFRVTVTKIDLTQLTSQFMELQIRGEGGIDRIRNITDQEITPELENINGVAGVQAYGGQQKSIEIRLNERACKAFGISISQVAGLLNNNGGDKTFVGSVKDGNNKLFVNVTSEYTDINDIGNIVVKQNGSITLKDIAQIFFGVKEQTSYSRVNGLDAVTVSLMNDNQANLIDLSHKTVDVINSLNKTLKTEGVEIVVQNNNAKLMEDNIDQIIHLAVIGGLLAVLILWFFLKNIRLVFVIGLSIPISVYAAFNFFYAYNITINSLTLVGMALAIGMLVDNSVVVLENIYRLVGQGRDIDTAVKQGTSEVWRSIFAATLTTITVFLPFIFSSNFLIRLIGRNIGVSIVSTLIISLLVALLFIPMATHFILKLTGRTRPGIFKKLSIHNRLIQGYFLALKACLRNPAGTIIGTLAVFFAALLVSLTLSISTTQEIETPSFRLSVTMPSGSTLDKTDGVVSEIEQRLGTLPEKEDIISRIEETDATVTVNLAKDWDKKSKRSLPEIKNDIMDKVKNIRTAEIEMNEISASGNYSQLGGGQGGVNPGADFMNLLGVGSSSESINIKGQNFEQMKSISDDIKESIQNLPIINSVNVNVQDNSPEVHAIFDMDYLGRNNITLSNVATALSTMGREYSSGATFHQGADTYDITLEYADENGQVQENTDKTIDDLKRLEVTGSNSNIMELQELANIVFSSGTGNIHRENQEKKITITYSFNSDITSSKDLLEGARAEIESIVSNINIPAGTAVEFVQSESSLTDFYYLIGMAFLLIYMILASVFESLSTPVVLMFSIPLAALGSLIALILTNNSLLNANTLVGFLILLGIVVNNGILLIDYTNILRKRGNRLSRALMTAGISRVRPILITASTTVVALFPLAMGKAEFVASIGAAFAITVIGGLTLSTMLTLIFIPTFYSGLENALRWIYSLNWKIKVIQLIVFSLLIILIYTHIEQFLWKLITTILALILVPASSWFFINTLRKARETLIAEDEPINIIVQSLVKIYDRESRLVREWRAGAKIRERLGLEKSYSSWNDMNHLLWQMPLAGFGVYFTYFYLKSGFWIFLFALGIWFSLFGIWLPFKKLLTSFSLKGNNTRLLKGLIKLVDAIIFWILPLVNLFLFQARWHNIVIVVILGFLWLSGLMIYKAGLKMTRENIDIYRLKGRFRTIRKSFYRMVRAIPLIGSKKKPFKALSCISLNITNGMFGLLGPNGAGKTTLMRIICGILEQSYGKVWINGMDTQEKREELQGLIGYLPQEFGSYENMTAHEYLHYQAMLKNITDTAIREKRVTYCLNAVHMIDHRHEKISSFSGGMKQRMGIAQILLHLPRILVVDEPTAGLDPRERIRFRNLLVELSRDRVVIFSTHIIEDISSSCYKVAVLNKGHMMYLGKPIEMTKEAEGHVWQFNIPSTDFNSFIENHLVVHHMSEGDKVRIRCISMDSPYPEAVNVTPNLEDAYLWLLRKKVRNAS